MDVCGISFVTRSYVVELLMAVTQEQADVRVIVKSVYTV